MEGKKPGSHGWYKVVLCEYKHTHVSTAPDPADNILTDLVSSQASHTRLGFHKEGPRNQKWSKWRLWSDPDQRCTNPGEVGAAVKKGVKKGLRPLFFVTA